MRAAIGDAARALEGTAEAIPLPDDSADAVTVGQAFHWFDGPAALAEIERVLRPGGALALVWNRRAVETSPLHQAISAIMAPYRGDAPSHGSGAWRDAFDARELTEWTFAFTQQLDADGLADRVGSTSFIAALDEPERRRVLERVRALAGDGPVSVPYVCEIHLWRPG
jgi:ubiquinone/menaquinone biosynthesis C-methylase UbiE